MERAEKWAWLHSPGIDLPFFTLGWLPPLLVFLWLSLRGTEPVCDVGLFPSCVDWAIAMYALGDWSLQIHRHYTLAMSYGDREHWARHRRLFTWFPVLLVAVLLPFALWPLYPPQMSYKAYVVLVVLAVPLFTWNLPHVVLQKYGFIRIYSARLGYGDAKLEKRLVLSWMFMMGGWAVFRYGTPALSGLTSYFHINVRFLAPAARALGYSFFPLALWAAWTTGRWVRDEVRNYRPRNIPKLLYVGSVACIMATGFYSAVVCFSIFAFSHGVEYVAFLSLYAPHRKSLRDWARSPITINIFCFPWTVLLLVGLYFKAPFYYFAYTLFQTYIHIVFDSQIWKMREAPVREAVLAIGSDA